jgi:capsular exopolysaccharide synthesis family protein
MPELAIERSDWDLRSVMTVLWRRRAIVAVFCLIVVGLAVTVRLSKTPLYVAEAALSVDWPITTYFDERAQARLLGGTVEMLKSRVLMEHAVHRLSRENAGPVADEGSIGPLVQRLHDRLWVHRHAQTNVVALFVRDENRVLSARVANALVAVFIEQQRANSAEYGETGVRQLRQEADLRRIERILEPLTRLRADRNAAGLGGQADSASQRTSRLEALTRTIVAESRSGQPRLEPLLAQLDAWLKEPRPTPSNEEDLVRLGQELKEATSVFLAERGRMSLAQAQTDGGGRKNEITYRIVTPAIPPLSPAESRWSATLALALALGLIGGVALAFVIDYADGSLWNEEDVLRSLGVPVLAAIPRIAAGEAATSDAVTESLRLLQNRIEVLIASRSFKTLMIASPSAGEGKTTLLFHLATRLAATDAGRQIVVVDGNLRNPTLHRLFELKQSPGLSDLLRGDRTDVESILQKTRHKNLQLLAAGASDPLAPDLMLSKAAAGAISDLSSHFDLVLLDSAPVVQHGETIALSRLADALLLVVASGETHDKAARQAQADLRLSGVDVLGAVLTKHNGSMPAMLDRIQPSRFRQ